VESQDEPFDVHRDPREAYRIPGGVETQWLLPNWNRGGCQVGEISRNLSTSQLGEISTPFWNDPKPPMTFFFGSKKVRFPEENFTQKTTQR